MISKFAALFDLLPETMEMYHNIVYKWNPIQFVLQQLQKERTKHLERILDDLIKIDTRYQKIWIKSLKLDSSIPQKMVQRFVKLKEEQ